MKPAEFDRKTVYIIGGSTGIGFAVATELVRLGADMLIFARRPEPLHRAVTALEALRRRPEQRIGSRQLDASDAGQVAAAMQPSIVSFGVPAVLINCAGRARPNYFERISAAQFAETLQVNLHACWHPIATLVPHMKAQSSGYIVNTASLAGLIGVFGYTDYCAAKFAVIGFSEALRSELRPHGIAVSVLCPPDTQTPGFDEENRTKPAETRVVSQGAKLLQPQHVARALLAGMARQSFLIIPGLDGRLAALAKRLVPRVVERLMDRRIRSAARPRP